MEVAPAVGRSHANLQIIAEAARGPTFATFRTGIDPDSGYLANMRNLHKMPSIGIPDKTMSPVVRNAAQLGHLLKSARRAAGLTQATLAARAGLNQSRVSTVERQPGRLTVDELLTLAATLDLELALAPRPTAGAAAPAASEW